MLKLGSRVNTPDGPGVVKVEEVLPINDEEVAFTGRLGILHDTYPLNKPKSMYKGDILYYFLRELSELS